MAITRHASARWEGDLKSGQGKLDTPQSGLLSGTRYGFNTRFEGVKGNVQGATTNYSDNDTVVAQLAAGSNFFDGRLHVVDVNRIFDDYRYPVSDQAPEPEVEAPPEPAAETEVEE